MAKDSEQGRRVVKGSLLIAGLVGLALLIFFLDDLFRAFERNYSIVALVPDAPGVAAGTPVWIGGLEVGEVLSVAILPTSVDTLGRIAVTMELPRRLREQVRTDSRVRLTSVSMMSEAAIDILPGSSAGTVLSSGDTLRRDTRINADQVTAQAKAVRKELDTVLSALRAITPAVSERMDRTERIAAELQGAMGEVERLRAEMAANQGLARLNDPAFRASLERARGHVGALPRLLEEARGRAGAADVRAALTRVQARADTLGAQLDAAAALLDGSHGFLGRMQQDTALSRAVTAARMSLDSLVAETRRNPLRFVF